MKEKVAVALSIAGFFGIMAISAKMHNNLSTDISTIDSSILIEEIPQQNVDDILPETNYIEDDAISSEKIYNELPSCPLESKVTDNFTFGEAFKYYRQCLGTESDFHWNGKTYSTLLLEEIIIQVADSTKSKELSDKNNTISATP